MIDLLEDMVREEKLLDHGFIRLVDCMPRIRGHDMDHAIVQAARVSYGKGTKTVSEDRGLIRYLMRHRHTTPFEMCEFKFHVKAPIFVARQWVRHRTASWNEVSARYSELSSEKYGPNEWRLQSTTNKQGSEEVADETVAWGANQFKSGAYVQSEYSYQQMLANDIAREQARIVLPVATYTEWYWKINLHNLLHFLSLRMDPHAQEEIRVYANVIGAWVGELAPHTWDAFTDFRLRAVSLTGPEKYALTYGAFNPTDDVTEREKREWEEKRRELGL